MQDIRDGLERLRALDPTLRTFGAKNHRHASRVVSAGEMDRFEASLGVELPGEYRRLLMEVGWGAGPYYGLWSPEELVRENLGLWEEYEEETGEAISPAEAFPFGPEQVAQLEARTRENEPKPSLPGTFPLNGCIQVCDQGCTFLSVLVTAGELRGTVWDVAIEAGFGGAYVPAARPVGIATVEHHGRAHPPIPSPPTFGQWYRSWLERCLSDLAR